MMIVAIDPGTTDSAFGILNHDGTFSCIKDKNDLILEALLMFQMKNHAHLAIEMIASYGMPVGREVFETCVWIGRFVERWGGDHAMIYRKDVKIHLCGSPKANDATIRQALIDRYGPGKDKAIGTKKNPGKLYGIKGDEWAALAVAVTHSDKIKGMP